MPSALDSSRLMSESIGKGRLRSSSLSLRQARCTYSLSTLTPNNCAPRSLNSRLSLPKAAISVGQTKVKSLGQKNTTCHLPACSPLLNCSNALLASFETTPVSAYAGNLSPIPNMICFSSFILGQSSGLASTIGLRTLAVQSIDPIMSIDGIYRSGNMELKLKDLRYLV